MLTLLGNHRERFCDGLSRRNFLRIGALGLGGAALPDILRAESQTTGRPPGQGLGHKEWGDPGASGFLGPSHAAFQPNGGGAEDMTLNGRPRYLVDPEFKPMPELV